MKNCAAEFSHFYKKKHEMRYLMWVYQHGSAEIWTNFTEKPIRLITNVF